MSGFTSGDGATDTVHMRLLEECGDAYIKAEGAIPKKLYEADGRLFDKSDRSIKPNSEYIKAEGAVCIKLYEGNNSNARLDESEPQYVKATGVVPMTIYESDDRLYDKES